jgi:polysaccharide export outer membrane protein
VRPGDRVSLDFHGESDLSTNALLVSSKGEIQLKMYDQLLKVEGMTLDEIKVKVESIYQKFLKNPTVVVRIDSTRPRYVTFFGFVVRPGPVELRHELGGITFMSALSLAGDISPRGSKSGIKLLREENGQIETYIIDYDDLVKGNVQDFPLKEGDRIYVSESLY